jgi:hypothetical protein
MDDDNLIYLLKEFNRSIDECLFHSMYDGEETHSLNHKEKKIKRSPLPSFVIDCPPFSLNEDVIREWVAQSLQASEVSVRWAEGPRGTCLVVDCLLPPSSLPPSSFTYSGKRFKIKYYHSLPSEYLFFDTPAVSFESSLLDCFSALQAGSAFPEHLEAAILSLLSDTPRPAVSTALPSCLSDGKGDPPVFRPRRFLDTAYPGRTFDVLV